MNNYYLRARKKCCISTRLWQLCILNNVSPKALARALGETNYDLFKSLTSRFADNNMFNNDFIEKLVQKFKISADFFYYPILLSSKLNKNDLFFVKRKFFLSQDNILKLNVINEWANCIVQTLEKDYVEFPRINLNRHERKRPYTFKEIYYIALKTRERFNLSGPISNIFDILESKGFILMKIPKQIQADFAIKMYRCLPPILLFKGNNEITRFNMAMGLGHYVLHLKLIKESILNDPFEYNILEKEAQWFAFFFLASTLDEDLAKTKVICTEYMNHLQDKWGISYVDLFNYIRWIKPQIKFDIKTYKLSKVTDKYKSQENTILRDSIQLIIDSLESKKSFLKKIPFYTNYIEEMCNLPPGYLSYEKK